MHWPLGALILVAVGVVLRMLLRLGAESGPHSKGLVPLDAEREALYQPVAREVETRAAILGIALNDAFEERDAGHSEIAWRLVQLSVGEWTKLAELVAALVKASAQNASATGVAVPFRSIAAQRFKSATMINFARMHELLDQLVFGSGLRFQLRLRLLRRATETLTAEFRRRYRYAEHTEDRPEELWQQLDQYFYDFDLLAKEALLAWRALLPCLPASALVSLSADVQVVVERSARSTPVVVERGAGATNRP